MLDAAWTLPSGNAPVPLLFDKQMPEPAQPSAAALPANAAPLQKHVGPHSAGQMLQQAYDQTRRFQKLQRVHGVGQQQQTHMPRTQQQTCLPQQNAMAPHQQQQPRSVASQQQQELRAGAFQQQQPKSGAFLQQHAHCAAPFAANTGHAMPQQRVEQVMAAAAAASSHKWCIWTGYQRSRHVCCTVSSSKTFSTSTECASCMPATTSSSRRVTGVGTGQQPSAELVSALIKQRGAMQQRGAILPAVHTRQQMLIVRAQLMQMSWLL